jgi:pimeloyl-ACP methyl ester carboxylesterase
MWLRDSLPKLIPQARFMTFGYDSVVFMSHSTSGVADFAIDLLERIRLNRQSAAEANRDIVFVCHSLGGIVCKKALVIAHERPEYAPMLDRVRGVIFMGTPHRGSRLASLAKPLANIINASLLSKRIRSDLLGNLQNSSSILADVSTSCVHRLASLRIVSFYEQNFLEPLGRLVS